MKPRIAVFLQPQHAEYDQIRAAAIESEKITRQNIERMDANIKFKNTLKDEFVNTKFVL